MVAVIMAGGKGTRIAGLNKEIPKPMFQLCGKPVLEYAIEELVAQGIKDIVLVVGYLGHVIKEYFCDGAEFDAKISYLTENQPLGTAGALYFLRDKIKDDFFLLNGDIIFSIDFHRLLSFHKQKGGLATLLVHPNSHPYDSGLVQYNYDGLVMRWLTKEDVRLWYQNRVNAGIHVLSPHIFSMFSELRKADLDRDILRQLIPQGALWAYYSTEYVKDMGTPERYEDVRRDLESGMVQCRNRIHKQRAIFLDRDGTLNVHDGYITRPEQICLLPQAADAVKLINRSGFLAVVITNQPVIARGECTIAELCAIHNALETKLGEQGAYLDAIYFCPHHPDKGFEGERKEYKIICECRKPKPGLILKSARDFNIDVSQSYMIGDEESDLEAGKSAGCRDSLLIGKNSGRELLASVQEILASGFV